MLTKPLRNLALFKQKIFRHAAMIAFPPAVAAAAFKIIDMNYSFLNELMPEKSVFQAFAATVSLLLVFRSVRALSIYHEGARGVHQMTGSWYDSASTLIAFCRPSTAPPQAVDDFKNTLVRLFSLLNMLCLVELEDAEEEHQSHAMEFSTIDIEGLDNDTLLRVKDSAGKPEVVCQAIQCLIVDSIETQVLSLPAPILSRAFQDLGNGMLKFHETAHLSYSPVPITLLLVTELLLLMNAIFSSFMLALWTKGPAAAALFTFTGNLILFSLNSLASEIENPFGGDFNDIDVRTLHYDLNIRLTELLELSTASSPNTSIPRAACEIHIESGSQPSTPLSRHMSQKSSKKSIRIRKADALIAKLVCGSEPLRQSSDSDHSGLASVRSSYRSSGDVAPTFRRLPGVLSALTPSHTPSAKSNAMVVSFNDRPAHEAEAASAAPNEVSPITPRVSTVMTSPSALGQVLERPRGDDEDNAYMLQMLPRHAVILL